jgi:hypothetical protein
MSSLANMLLGQAAPSSALSGLDPATIEALKALNGEAGVPTGPPPATLGDPTLNPANRAMMDRVVQGAIDRSNAPAPAPATPQSGNRIMQFLMNLLPSTKSLAPQGQPTPRPPTPEELAARNQAIAGGQ